MHLNNVSIHVFTFPPTPPPLPSCNVTRLRELLYNDIQCAGLFPRKETGHLLFSHSDMKRHFYFCRPPLSRTASLGVHSPLFLSSSKLSRGYQCPHIFVSGVYDGVSRRLTIWISLSYLQRISSPSDIAVLPIFRIPSLIVLRASCILESSCQCAFVRSSRIARFLCACQPLVSVFTYLK